MSTSKRLPVTILTGFLGSGKTTLLDRILSDAKNSRRIAVIQNEFGDSIRCEDELKREKKKNAACVVNIFLQTSGCIHCSGSDDFLRVLRELVDHKDKLDAVVLETTGMADPTFLNLFFSTEEFRATFAIDSVVTLVDAKHGLERLNSKNETQSNGITILNEAIEQLIAADKIIINKIDLVDETSLQLLEHKIKEINNTATIHKTKYSEIDTSTVINAKTFSMSDILARDKGFRDFRPYRQHDSAISSASFAISEELDHHSFSQWISTFLNNKENKILRTKGLLRFKGKTESYLLQGVVSDFSLVPINQETDVDEEEVSTNMLIFIGRDLDDSAIKESFSVFNAPAKLIRKNPEESSSSISLRSIAAIGTFVAAILYGQGRWLPYTQIASVLFVLLYLYALVAEKIQKTKKKKNKANTEKKQN